MTRVLPRLVAACLVVGAAVLGGPFVGGATAAAADGALLRIAHLSSDTPAVDVIVTAAGRTAAEFADAGYGDVSDYTDLPAGTYTLAVRGAGAAPDTPAVLSTTIDLPAGAARTVALSGAFADLRLEVGTDDLSAPPDGAGRLRVLDGTSGDVDVRLPDGTELSGPVTVPRGPTPVRLIRSDGPSTVVPLDVPAGSVQTLLLLEDPDGALRVRPVVDAAGTAVTPSGAVEAGGGPVDRSASFPAAVGLLTAAALLGSGRLHRPRIRRAVSGVGTVAAVVALAVPTPAPGSAAPVPVPAATIEHLAPTRVALPVRVRLPAIGLDAPLAAVRTRDDGTLAPPDTTATAGWFADGPRPGETGPAVLAAHVDWAGEAAAFARLTDARPGDEILVQRADGSTGRFTVTAVERHAKGDFPTADVYGPAPGAELRLITCGGEFDRASGSYRENVIVTAIMAP